MKAFRLNWANSMAQRPIFFDFFALFFGDALGQAAGDGGAGVDFAPADHLDHGMAVLAHLDDLAADFQPDLVDDAQDVAFGNRGIRTHDEVRAAQGIEVGGVVGAVEGGVEQLAQLLAGGRDFDMVDGVDSLGGGHVVRLGADAADAVGQQGHFFHRATDAEAFESAQFGDLEVGVGDIALFVQEDLDLAVTFQAGDGINCNSLCMVTPLLLSCADLLPAGANRPG